MDYRITKEYVWSGGIPDRPDALAEKLRALRDGGLNLELIIARRDATGDGVLFVSPLRTVEEIEKARQAGLAKSESFMSLRIEGPNRKGIAALIASAVALAEINLRGYAAVVLGDRHVTSLAFDSKADVDKAKAVLERTLAEG